MKKSRANRLGMYADIRHVADLALSHGGGEYACTTHGDAIHWRQRFYRFRKLYGEVYHPDGSENPYDVLMLPKIPEESTTVHITMRRHVGTFTPAGGHVATDISADSDLFDIASNVAKKIKGEE